MLPEPVKAILRYARRVLKALDQLANVITGGAVCETISSRMARLRDKGVFVGCVMCRMLDLIQKNHCDKAKH